MELQGQVDLGSGPDGDRRDGGNLGSISLQASQSSKSWSHQESGSTLSKPFNQAAPRTANEEEVEGGWGMVGGGVAEVTVRRQTNNCCSRKSGSGSGERSNSVKGEHHGVLVDGETLWEEVKNVT